MPKFMAGLIRSPARVAVFTYLFSWTIWYAIVMEGDFEQFLYYFATLGGAGRFALAIQLMAIVTTAALTLGHSLFLQLTKPRSGG